MCGERESARVALRHAGSSAREGTHDDEVGDGRYEYRKRTQVYVMIQNDTKFNYTIQRARARGEEGGTFSKWDRRSDVGDELREFSDGQRAVDA